MVRLTGLEIYTFFNVTNKKNKCTMSNCENRDHINRVKKTLFETKQNSQFNCEEDLNSKA